MYVLYTALIVLFAIGRLALAALPGGALSQVRGSLPQRFGYLPVSFNIDAESSIWIHAVSVGELLTARPLITALRARHPGLRIFVSTTTGSAQQLARRSVPDADAVFYFPFDLGLVVRRTLDLVKPRLFLMMETEIWPNLLRECRARGIKTAVVNGRLSSRSFPRYRLARGFFRHVLADIDAFCVQSRGIGAALRRDRRRPDRVTVTGSLKFDSLEPVAPAAAAAARAGAALLPVRAGPAGAGRRQHDEGRGSGGAPGVPPGEDGTAARAVLMLAPRHPERFAEVVQQCEQEGFRTVRRSDLPIDAEPRADVVVLDTIGELATVYQLAHGGVRRRQPGADRRPQHPRAGGLRQAGRLRAAHAELRRDCRRRSSPTAPAVQVDGEGAFEAECWRS